MSALSGIKPLAEKTFPRIPKSNKVEIASTFPMLGFTVCIVERVIEMDNPDKEGFGKLTSIRRFVFRTPEGKKFAADLKKRNTDQYVRDAVSKYRALLTARDTIRKQAQEHVNLFGPRS